MYCVSCQWRDLEQAREFAEDVSKQYPNLKLYLDELPELDKEAQERFEQMFNNRTPAQLESESYCNLPGDEG